MLVLPAELTHKQTPASLRMLVQGLRAETGNAVVADASALALALIASLGVAIAQDVDDRRQRLEGFDPGAAADPSGAGLEDDPPPQAGRPGGEGG